jgi:hypothetical protein
MRAGNRAKEKDGEFDEFPEQNHNARASVTGNFQVSHECNETAYGCISSCHSPRLVA